MSISVGPKPRASHQASHSSVVTSVTFSGNGRILASGSWDGAVKLWDVSEGKPKLKRTFRGEWDEVEAVCFVADGSMVAGLGTGFDGSAFGVVTLWSVDSTRPKTVVCEPGKIDSIAFTPDGATLATGSGDTRAVSLWDVASGDKLALLPDHRGPIWSIDYAPDGKSLAVASGFLPTLAGPSGIGQSGEICLWDLSQPRIPRPSARLVGHEHGIVSVSFSPDGASIVSGGFDRVARTWDVETGRELLTFTGHEGWVSAVAFSPDGSMIATGSHDQTVRLWDAATGREIVTLRGHTGNVYAVAFSPDGSSLASGSLDCTVKLWDLNACLAQLS